MNIVQIIQDVDMLRNINNGDTVIMAGHWIGDKLAKDFVTALRSHKDVEVLWMSGIDFINKD